MQFTRVLLKTWGDLKLYLLVPVSFLHTLIRINNRESSHAVYSVYRAELNKYMEYDIIGDLRLESISKVKISHPVTWNKLDEKDLIEDTDFISPGILY